MANIVLIGFMGTGKSSVGRVLAAEFGCRFLDLDTVIEKLSGRTISEIFETDGEERFRGLETVIVERLVAGEFGSNLVVSTGGGTIVSESNRRALREWGKVVCLSASVEAILERVGKGKGRPLAEEADSEALAELLRSREEFYSDSDFTVETSTLSIMEVVQIIKGHLLLSGRRE
ncbi:MAG: shikimate kinase [Proteobacteria bacterium]|nr:shikimate kinase [Pseudomonadota bacterium]